jgi:hypothetical protein
MWDSRLASRARAMKIAREEKRESHPVLLSIMASSNNFPRQNSRDNLDVNFGVFLISTVVLETPCRSGFRRRRHGHANLLVGDDERRREYQQGTRTSARNLQAEREEVDDWFLSAKHHDKKHELCVHCCAQSVPKEWSQVNTSRSNKCCTDMDDWILSS